MTPDAPTPSSPLRPAPRFTWASWIVMVGGLVLTYGVWEWAYIHRRPGDWLPGLAEALIGIGLTAVASFICGLTALLRRERNSWLAWLPFLAGFGVIAYAAVKMAMR